jgi:hypothetical protein
MFIFSPGKSVLVTKDRQNCSQPSYNRSHCDEDNQNNVAKPKKKRALPAKKEGETSYSRR